MNILMKSSLYQYIEDKGLPIDFIVLDPSLGNYVLPFQGQKAQSAERQYWALYYNGALSNSGFDTLVVKEGN